MAGRQLLSMDERQILAEANAAFERTLARIG
jgi:hypothetical protein